MAQQQQQFVVIGAGIAGLATAVALQRRGHDVTVLEGRADTTSGAGISIWPNALAALTTSAWVTRSERPAAGCPPERCVGVTAHGYAPRRESES